MGKVVERIARDAGVEPLADILAERLSPTDLQSLMLPVYARRAAARGPGAVLADYERGRFFGASPLPAAAFTAFEGVAQACAEGFEFLVLSPMAPLAACSAVATVGQDWSIPTARTGEVVSDPTNVLALEAALRRRRDPGPPVHLATCQRVVRPQASADPRRLAHFSLLALVSAGRDAGAFRTEAEMIGRHLDALIGTVRRFVRGDLPLSLSWTLRSDSHGDARLAAVEAAAGRHGVPVFEDAERAAADGYYAGFCFNLWLDTEDGRRQLADGGAVDWVAKLTSNGKERALISGCGIDGLVALAAGR